MDFKEYLNIIKTLSVNRGDVCKALEINSDYKKVLVDLIQDVFEYTIQKHPDGKTTEAVEDLLKTRPVFNKFSETLSKKELQRLIFVVQATVKFFVSFVEPDLMKSMSEELEQYKKELNILFKKHQEFLRSVGQANPMGADDVKH